ncbi:hypothetical protein NAPIS_ORF00060 [Vairimorpha apis BRL 01]|uniref:Uncharacterized protein n=1 Tax=Vairimorpha apis BRL 01 TaxID=1037528 RepID=T0L4E5_9MICR|nr:hypothetical protein NAPIS_ORF00060 [Vairimorpha apis BRL 01]
MLYAYNHEKEYFDIYWKEKLVNILFISNLHVNKLNYFKKICEKNLKDKLTWFNYKLYFGMKSLNIVYNLDNYNKIFNDTSQLKFINYLVDAVNNIKCRLLNIENIKKIENL